MIDFLKDLYHRVYNVEAIVLWGGLVGVCAIVFAETGLMIGFFLPGDSLLVTAGLIAAGGSLNIWLLIPLASVCAILGDALGYWIGFRAGVPLYRKKDRWYFKKKHLLRTKEFFETHGGKAIVMARFVPIVRTFTPVVAGVAKMPYKNFAFFNIWGGIGWVSLMTLLGYGLGQAFPWMVKRIDVLALVIIFLSLIPLMVEYLKHKLKR